MISAAIPIHPIKSEDDYDAAIARIQELLPGANDATENDELDILVTLVDRYETEHFPIQAPEPITFLLCVLDQRGLSRKDLEPMIGSRARVSEVLSRKRNLTLSMIRRLSAGLQIPADQLIDLPRDKAQSGSVVSSKRIPANKKKHVSQQTNPSKNKREALPAK